MTLHGLVAPKGGRRIHWTSVINPLNHKLLYIKLSNYKLQISCVCIFLYKYVRLHIISDYTIFILSDCKGM